QQVGRRVAYRGGRRPGGRDEGRGAVLRGYQWPEQAPARDRVEIDRRGARQLVRRVGLCPLVPHGVVPARDAIELVYRVQAEQVRPGVPLEDVRIHVERVARQLVHRQAVIGQGDGGAEAWGRHRLGIGRAHV